MTTDSRTAGGPAAREHEPEDQRHDLRHHQYAPRGQQGGEQVFAGVQGRIQHPLHLRRRVAEIAVAAHEQRRDQRHHHQCPDRLDFARHPTEAPHEREADRTGGERCRAEVQPREAPRHGDRRHRDHGARHGRDGACHGLAALHGIGRAQPCEQRHAAEDRRRRAGGRGQHQRLLRLRHERGHAEGEQQHHRHLQQRGRRAQQPRRPRVQQLQQSPGAWRAGRMTGKHHLVDDVARQRAQVEQQLVRGRKRPRAAGLEARVVGPVELVEVDRAAVGAALERDARRLVECVALGGLVARQQVVGQRDAEIVRGARRAAARRRAAGSRLRLAAIEVARRAGARQARALGLAGCGGGRSGRGMRGVRRQRGDRNQHAVRLAFAVARRTVGAVAQQARELAHRLPRQLVRHTMHGDDRDALVGSGTHRPCCSRFLRRARSRRDLIPAAAVATLPERRGLQRKQAGAAKLAP